MTDRMTYSEDHRLRVPFLILGIVYAAMMGVLVAIRSVLVYVFTILLAALEAEFTSDMIFDIIANVLIIAAYSFITVGVFMMRKTVKPYAIGWICYSLQVLVGCVFLPLISDSYGEPQYPVMLMLMYILLAVGAGSVGLMMLLGCGSRWLLLVCTAVSAALFAATLIMGESCYVGTLGATIPYLTHPFYLVSIIITNSALFGGMTLTAISYKSTYY